VHELDYLDVLHYTLSAMSVSTTLNYLDTKTANSFTESYHTKSNVLECVSHGLRNVDVYWSKMLLGFVSSRSCYHSI